MLNIDIEQKKQRNTVNIMLTEQCKDKVYFSGYLQKDYKGLFNEVTSILDANHVPHGILESTKDYWCRDYMPIQWGYRQYAQFVYDPDYVEDKKYLTDTDKVLTKVKEPIDVLNKSPLVIDGGNMVFCRGGKHPDYTDYVVMTDKVMKENPSFSQEEIERCIQEALIREGYSNSSLQIVWLPWNEDKEDRCGHTDGILRYVGISKEGKPIVLVLVNLEIYDKERAEGMRSALSKYFELIDLKLSRYDVDYSWAYINMLQTRDVIIVPGIGDEVTDKEALDQIKGLFPQYEGRIYQVQMKEFIDGHPGKDDGGGALNCCTWTISNEMSSVPRTEANIAHYKSLVEKAKKNEDSLSPEDITFLGDYDPIALASISHSLDNIYWGF
jgi:agmatine/peptidylarginine deiminase